MTADVKSDAQVALVELEILAKGGVGFLREMGGEFLAMVIGDDPRMGIVLIGRGDVGELMSGYRKSIDKMLDEVES